MSNEQSQKDYFRGQLKDMMKRVPKKINEAGIEATRAFKKWHIKTTKVVDNDRATLTMLSSAFNEATGYYA